MAYSARNYVKILGFNSGKGNLKTGYCIGNQFNIQKTVRCIADQTAAEVDFSIFVTIDFYDGKIARSVSYHP